jgi:hypothetical protein
MIVLERTPCTHPVPKLEDPRTPAQDLGLSGCGGFLDAGAVVHADDLASMPGMDKIGLL